MKKITKIESARIIVKQKGICYNYNHSETISCDDCFNGRNVKKCINLTDEETLALAEAYIKRHESKSKKKDHIVDKHEKVEEPCVKDCPVNSEYPDPIRVDIPDIFYCPTPHGILRFKRSQIILKDTNNEDCLLKLHDEYPCYRTIEEALQVAKKLWNGEGK